MAARGRRALPAHVARLLLLMCLFSRTACLAVSSIASRTPVRIQMLLANTQIRQADPEEIPEVAGLQLEVFAPRGPQPALLPFLAEMYEAKQAEARRGMRSRLANELKQRIERGSTIFIASLGKHAREVIGTVDLSYHEMELPTHSLSDGLYVSTLCVDPEYRKNGIGKALMEAVEAEAEGRGASGIYLHVEASNDGALALYESAGYSKLPKTPMYNTFTTALHLSHREPLLMYKPLAVNEA